MVSLYDGLEGLGFRGFGLRVEGMGVRVAFFAKFSSLYGRITTF